MDCGLEKGFRSLTNMSELSPSFTLMSSYNISLQCYEYIGKDKPIKVFNNDDTFVCNIGNQMWSTTPVIQIDPSHFITTGYASGIINYKLSLTMPSLKSAMTGHASKNYTMQVWCRPNDNPSGIYLVLSSNITVNNVTTSPT